MLGLTQYFDAGDAAPEDVLVAKIQRLLAADAKLVQVFGATRIESVPILAPPGAVDMPRLQVAHEFAPEEDSVPGSADLRQVNLVLRILLDWPSYQPLMKGAPTADAYGTTWPVPSLATVETHIHAVVKAARKLAETVEGQSVQLVRNGPRIGGFATAGVIETGTGGVAVARDCRVSYGVELDHDSGRIRNVVAAEAA